MSHYAFYNIKWLQLEKIKQYLQTQWEFVLNDHNKNNNVEVVLSFAPKIVLLEKYPKLKYLLSPGAGVDRFNLNYLKKRNIMLVNSHANAASVSEHAWSLLMALTRKLPLFCRDKNINEGFWPETSIRMRPSSDLYGKNLGLLGFGRIGKILAEYGNAFGMKVWVFKRTSISPVKFPAIEKICTNDELDYFLANVDYIISSLPLTSATRGLISQNQFLKMKKGVYIVIISRAPIFDEKALFNALENGIISGLAMDPQYKYPHSNNTKKYPFSNYPFHLNKNVILTPYRAWISLNAWESLTKDLAQNLDRIANNKIPETYVDYTKEY